MGRGTQWGAGNVPLHLCGVPGVFAYEHSFNCTWMLYAALYDNQSHIQKRKDSAKGEDLIVTTHVTIIISVAALCIILSFLITRKKEWFSLQLCLQLSSPTFPDGWNCS